jgi:L-iditol 2-dehydrogenase
MTTIPPTMRASVLLAAQSLSVEDRPVPALDADQVLVEVTAVGVCGSDVHFWHDGHLGDWVVDKPLVLGHESGGRIVAVGSEVDQARVGQRVSIEPQRPTPTSRETLAGRYNPGRRWCFRPVRGYPVAFRLGRARFSQR